jgi:hypothetical protein
MDLHGFDDPMDLTGWLSSQTNDIKHQHYIHNDLVIFFLTGCTGFTGFFSHLHLDHPVNPV